MRLLTRTIATLLLLCCLPGKVVPQYLSEHVANYDMDVVLDVDQHRLLATTDLTWFNPSTDTVLELQFHLYLNAFRNNMTTWVQEGYQFMDFLGSAWYEDCGWGWTRIEEMYDSDGNDLTAGFAFLQPEDDNPEDHTVLSVPLMTPVLPGDSAEIRFTWTVQIPRAMVRSGYNREFYFMAQWFPKLGVYEPAGMRYAKEGGWNCHQYHANTEYYADFGMYNVNITVPNDFIVAASGVLQDKANVGDGKTRWTFYAPDVIDFTWSASPHFIVIDRRWKDTDLALYLYPEHACFAPRYFEPLEFALSYLDSYIGDYPYPKLTVVGAPIHGIFAGAMEYPTLITAFATALLPSGFRSTETLVTHEFIHQYFMQMVATNEQEEAWMDEGITSYYEALILDSLYGPKTSMVDWLGFRVGNFENARHGLLSSGYATSAPGALPAWEYHPTAYSVIAYDKTALWLKTLEGLIGVDVMREVMRTYFEQWKFRHPCGQDFRDVVNTVVAKRLSNTWPDGMDWFFVQVLDGAELCDYRVQSIENRKVRPPIGYFDDPEICIVPGQSGEQEIQYHSMVVLVRDGGLIVPVDVRVIFEDGTTVTERWDPQSGMQILNYAGAKQITSVEIDPGYRNYLDTNYLNNSRTVDVRRKGLAWYTATCLNGIQHLMESLTILM